MKVSFDQLGINKNSYLTYKALLKLGPSSIRQIAEESGINRGTTHDFLKKLLKKGLVSYQLKGKRKHYLAEPPEKLLQITNEKQKALKKIRNLLSQEVIPHLKSQKFIRTKPLVRYYEDDEGIEQVLKDVLQIMRKEEKKEYFVFSALPMRKYLYRFFPNFTKQRIKNKIAVKVIALGKGGEPAVLSKRKWLQVDARDTFSSYIIIYGEKLALISLTKEELPYAVVIEEQSVTQAMRLIFASLWKLL